MDINWDVSNWGEHFWKWLPRWRGMLCYQFPTDLWRYAELCFELEPAFVLEIGVEHGGTATFLSDILSLIGRGRVIGVDIKPMSGLISYVTPVQVITGDSKDPAIIDQVYKVARYNRKDERGLVLLDSDHHQNQVAAELEAYADLASYLVCEDTTIQFQEGTIAPPNYGPHIALRAWLPHHPEFVQDPDPSPTNHPGGWLRRIGE